MNAQQVPQCKQRRVTYLLTYILKKRNNIGSCPQVPVYLYMYSDTRDITLLYLYMCSDTQDITLLYLYMYSDTNNHFVNILYQLYLGIVKGSITGNG
jgi:hypothetical protein